MLRRSPRAVRALNCTRGRRIRRTVCRASSDGLMEWDVVCYGAESALQIGLVVEVTEETVTVEPLEREGKTEVWLQAWGEAETVPRRRVRLIDAEFGQRMSMDRVSNPHGEHAEYFWEISEPSLGEDKS
mmetsp:Transcript_25969/g.85408  ORF Transcript_25969/g.85408 Transcript_25969/m.85408 type:complete len:129 (+) Transcript_25969:1161-1547(+)